MKIFTGQKGSDGKILSFLEAHHRIRFIMKVSLFYFVLIAASLQLIAAENLSGQNLDTIKVTTELKNAPLSTLLKQITDQTGLSFAYMENLNDAMLNLPKGTRSVRATLNEALASSDLDWVQTSNTILVIKKKKTEMVSSIIGNSPVAFQISGAIKSSAGEVLAGVNIIVKGTTKGTTSDANGEYKIEVDSNDDILVFSFIGFKTIETQVSGRTRIDLTMEDDATTLGSVEIVGTNYFSTEKEFSTMNIAKVDAKDIEKQPVTSTLMSLQGRMAGVDISPVNNSGPGGAIRIQIRGQNSLRTGGAQGDGNLPLYVVDGVPLDPRPLESGSGSIYQNGFDPLSAINPSNIENIQVLKDAAATAIYGSRGSNGVVLITTKQGSKSGNTNIDVSAYTGIAQISNRMDVLNREQYLEMRREAFKNDGLMPGVTDYDLNGTWDTTRTTNWQKELLGHTAKVYDAQVNFSGGNTNTTFLLGGGFHKETSPLKDDFGFQRMTVLLNVNHTSSDNRFRGFASINYGTNKSNQFDDGNFIPLVLRLEPVAPQLFTETGALNWQIAKVNNSNRNTWTNPLSYLKKTDDSSMGNIIGSANFSYELIPGLQIKTNLGFTQLNADELIKSPIGARSPTSISNATKGVSTFGSNQRKSWIIEPQVSFSRTFRNHKIDAVIGSTLQQSDYKMSLTRGAGYSSDALLNTIRGATTVSYNNDDSQYRYIAILAHLGYSYNEKYLLNLSGRRDGSSRFGPGNRFGTFYSISGGWIFSKENLIADNVSFLSFGKIRASYGTTGNDQIGDYKFYNTYSIYPTLYQGGTSAFPDAIYNPNFGWEVTKKTEAGVELGFVKNRISLEVSWYRNRSSNQLIDYQTPLTTGFNSIFTNFNATVENTGWEVVVNSANIMRENFKWSTSFNASFPKNTLVDFPNIESSPYATVYKVGEPLSVQYLYTYTGVNSQDGLREFRDVDNNDTYDYRDQELMLPLVRNYLGGINNTFSYANFELSILFQYMKYYSSGFSFGTIPGRMGNQPIDVTGRWQNEGDIASVGKYTQTSDNYSVYGTQYIQSSANTRQISFLRLKTLSFAYRINNQLTTRVGLKDARVYIQGQNLFTISDDTRLDPETGYGLPPLRIINLGIQFKL